MSGRLNLFQAAMLRWRDLHPYNAVHAARVAQPFDALRLRAAIDGQLEHDGLTGLVLDRARLRFEYRGAPAAAELAIVETGGDAEAALHAEIERQLNRPFPRSGALEPFRFFACADADGFYLGLAYDHFVAGGDSIAALLCAIIQRHAGAPQVHARPNRYPPPFGPLLRRNAGKVVAGLPWLRRVAASRRRAVRPRYDDHADGRNAVRFVRIDGPAFAALLAQAKAWGVTFNDLLLAAVVHVLAKHVPPRGAQRNEIAVASIVNLRGELGFAVSDVFGQFLSSLRISHPAPAGIALATLAHDVHAETARIKARKLYLPALVAVRASGLVWSYLNERRRQRFYPKAYPVLAGLTTLNINALWTPPDDPTFPRRYVRAVPTGPVAPLVVAATTCGDAVELALSYRVSAELARNIDRIAADLRTCLQSFP